MKRAAKLTRKPKRVFVADPSQAMTAVGDIPLNEGQAKLVNTLNGPVWCLAGPGTGKTFTLAVRYCQLVRAGVAPEHIWVISFSKDAVREFREAVCKLLGVTTLPKARICTFHTLCARYLALFPVEAGLDGYDFERCFNDAVADELYARAWSQVFGPTKYPDPAQAKQLLDFAASSGQSLRDAARERYPHMSQYVPRLACVRDTFAEFKQQEQVLDYNDVLLVAGDLFKTCAAARKHARSHHAYLFVDEMNDTNVVQAQILHLIVNKRQNIVVVGDPRQCMYEWRGAAPDNMTDFRQGYRCVIIELSVSYRSAVSILEFVNALMRRMPAYRDALLNASRKDVGDGVSILRPGSEKEMWQTALVRAVRESLEKASKPSQVAVLCPHNAHVDRAARALLNAGIEVSINHEHGRHAEAPEARALLAVPRLILNPQSRSAVQDLLHLGTGLTFDQAVAAVGDVSGSAPLSERLAAFGRRRGGQIAARIVRTTGLLRRLEAKPRSPSEVIRLAFEFVQPLVLRWGRGATERLDAMLALAAKYQSLSSYLHEIGEIIDLRPRDVGVVISTIHRSKGHEYEQVIVTHVIDRYFPNPKATASVKAESQRVLFVAASRAKNGLTLLCPETVTEKGATVPCGLSRYLQDIEADGVFQVRDERVASSTMPSAMDRLEKAGVRIVRRPKLATSWLQIAQRARG